MYNFFFFPGSSPVTFHCLQQWPAHTRPTWLRSFFKKTKQDSFHVKDQSECVPVLHGPARIWSYQMTTHQSRCTVLDNLSEPTPSLNLPIRMPCLSSWQSCVCTYECASNKLSKDWIGHHTKGPLLMLSISYLVSFQVLNEREDWILLRLLVENITKAKNTEKSLHLNLPYSDGSTLYIWRHNSVVN